MPPFDGRSRTSKRFWNRFRLPNYLASSSGAAPTHRQTSTLQPPCLPPACRYRGQLVPPNWQWSGPCTQTHGITRQACGPPAPAQSSAGETLPSTAVDSSEPLDSFSQTIRCPRNAGQLKLHPVTTRCHNLSVDQGRLRAGLSRLRPATSSIVSDQPHLGSAGVRTADRPLQQLACCASVVHGNRSTAKRLRRD